MGALRFIAGGLALTLTMVASADEVIVDDLIVQSSMCVGADCVDGEDFDFDTLRLKSPTPQIHFWDTSNSASFPSEDWSMGITDGGTASRTSFFVRSETASQDVLVISPDGDVALGTGAELVEGAVSVGNLGSERRVSHVADAVNDTDAVNLRQFEAFQTTAEAATQQDIEALNSRLDGFEARMAALLDRLDRVADKVAQLQAIDQDGDSWH